MNNENTLPPIGSVGDSMLEDIRPYLLDPRKDYPEPYYMLEFNGIPFSAIGGIQAISGQKKNGKSFVLAQLMAAILGNGSERVMAYLPGLKVPDRTIDMLGHLPKVLYVDTEMEELNSAKVLRRVHWLCGWDMKEPNDRFNVLWLRTVGDNPDEKERAFQRRFRYIIEAIEVLEPDIVFIDGIRDIIGDFNDNAESSDLVTRLMAIAQEKNICIWSALHMNPRPGNDDDSKMRGHLGTELGNKVSDTLVSVKQKTPNGVTFTVKQVDARGKDMEDWRFEVTDAAGSLGIPKIFGSGPNLTATIKAHTLTEVRNILEEFGNTIQWPATVTEIKGLFKKGGIKSNNELQECVDIAKTNDLLCAQSKEEYEGGQKHPKYYLPYDLQNNLPF